MPLLEAEVITIGDEILYGQIIDTNSQWISDALTSLGVEVVQKRSIGDRMEDILDVLAAGMEQGRLLILTGGLGPTLDDMTKPALATFFESDMVMNEDALGLITSFFAKRGRPMLEANRQQAMLPAKAEYLQNTTGTAPGMWFDHPSGGVVVSLPGVPYEMRHLMQEHVLPRIESRFQLPIIEHLYLRTIGIGESFIAHKIAEWEASLPPYIRLAYLPSVYQVKLRLTARGNDRTQLQIAIAEKAAEVIPLLGQYLYAEQNVDIQECVAALLAEQGYTLGTAESCTGGALAALITSQPGSSRYFKGSVIAYANEVKVHQLGVSDQTLAAHGAVSEATVREMALGIQKVLGTDVGIATSGIAGPDGGTPDKPVGTVWIALACDGTVHTRLLQLAGSRENNIRASVLAALDMVRLSLTGKLVSKA